MNMAETVKNLDLKETPPLREASEGTGRLVLPPGGRDP